MAGLRNDLDDVAVAQLVTQRHDAPVHLRSYAGISHFGVDVICEVDASGITRQNYNLAFRSECVDLFGIEIDLKGREKCIGGGDVALPLDHLSQQRETP